LVCCRPGVEVNELSEHPASVKDQIKLVYLGKIFVVEEGFDFAGAECFSGFCPSFFDCLWSNCRKKFFESFDREVEGLRTIRDGSGNLGISFNRTKLAVMSGYCL
jgi:hypothetical protein